MEDVTKNPTSSAPVLLREPSSYRAYEVRYDYEAEEDNEVSTLPDDTILGVGHISEGWMIGTVQTSGKRGMMPTNYCERVNTSFETHI